MPAARVRAARVRAALCLAVAAVVGVVGCGLGDDAVPRAVPAERVPFGLLEPSSTTPSESASPGDESVEVYFVRDERLVAVDRDLEEATPVAVLTALLEGETSDDPAGIATLIPAGTGFATPPVVQQDGTLVVDLTGGITNIQGDELRTAFAQLVWTATGNPDVDQVRFLFDGDPNVEVLTDQGALADPVDRSDFNSLRPEPLPTTPSEPAPGSSTRDAVG